MLTLFSLWKSQSSQRQQDFDCDFCQAQGRLQSRACYKETKTIFIEIPQFDENRKPLPSVIRECEQDEFLEVLESLNQLNPKLSLLETWQNKFNIICPQAFFDAQSIWLIQLEAICRDYHVLPYPGSLLEQPMFVIEAFSIINGARKAFEASEAEKERQRARQQQEQRRQRVR